MKRFSCFLLGVVLIVGCQKGMIRVDALSLTMFPVMNRHDAYVEEDPRLSTQDKLDFLRSTSLLREAFKIAEND